MPLCSAVFYFVSSLKMLKTVLFKQMPAYFFLRFFFFWGGGGVVGVGVGGTPQH